MVTLKQTFVFNYLCIYLFIYCPSLHNYLVYICVCVCGDSFPGMTLVIICPRYTNLLK